VSLLWSQVETICTVLLSSRIDAEEHLANRCNALVDAATDVFVKLDSGATKRAHLEA